MSVVLQTTCGGCPPCGGPPPPPEPISVDIVRSGWLFRMGYPAFVTGGSEQESDLWHHWDARYGEAANGVQSPHGILGTFDMAYNQWSWSPYFTSAIIPKGSVIRAGEFLWEAVGDLSADALFNTDDWKQIWIWHLAATQGHDQLRTATRRHWCNTPWQPSAQWPVYYHTWREVTTVDIQELGPYMPGWPVGECDRTRLRLERVWTKDPIVGWGRLVSSAWDNGAEGISLSYYSVGRLGAKVLQHVGLFGSRVAYPTVDMGFLADSSQRTSGRLVRHERQDAYQVTEWQLASAELGLVRAAVKQEVFLEDEYTDTEYFQATLSVDGGTSTVAGGSVSVQLKEDKQESAWDLTGTTPGTDAEYPRTVERAVKAAACSGKHFCVTRGGAGRQYGPGLGTITVSVGPENSDDVVTFAAGKC